MKNQWLGAISDRAVREVVGGGAYVRGREYARQGRVSELTIEPDEQTISATVLGSRRSVYYTEATLDTSFNGGSGRWSGYCTCPVGEGCKHMAAVLLTAREQDATEVVPPAATSWEGPLTELVSRYAGRAPAVAAAPLALQFELTAHPQPGGGTGAGSGAPRVALRPVTLGKTGNWVRTGVSWRDLQYSYGHTQVPEHRVALRELYAAYQARDHGYYANSSAPIHLDEFSGSLWPLLQRAQAAGVQLVPAKDSPGPIRIASRPATVAFDLRRDPATATTILEPVVTIEGRPLPVASVGFIGEPAHGLLLEDADPPAGSSGLLLAAVDERQIASVGPLVQRRHGIQIPDADLDRFLRFYLPGLRKAVDVASSDDSVELPEVLPPRLALTVHHLKGHRLTLDWSFAYTVGDQVERLALQGSDGETVLRDQSAEEQLLAGLDLPYARLPQLYAATEQGPRLLPQTRLEAMDAVTFTEEILPELQRREDALVEVTGTAPDYRFSEAAPDVRLSTSDSPDDRDWFDLGVTVSIEGEQIPFNPLFVALAHGESHLLLASGTYFSIERPELTQLRQLIEEARGLQDRESDGLRLSVYQATLWEELARLGVVEAQSKRWSRSVQGLLDLDQVVPPLAPKSMDATLRPYQLEGYQWLSFLREHELGGILADDMGLGKTIQTLAMICRAHEAEPLDPPFLVVAPTSVVGNWAHEAQRFAPGLDVTAITQTQAKAGQPLADRIAGRQLVVTSYALFRIDYEAYAEQPWSGLILDEAQFVKNHQAKTYQCARRLPAPFKLAITGTPLENSLMDLWSLLSIVAPGLFPTPARFSERYRKPIESGTDPELLATLRRRIRPLMRRRTKEQVATELPPKQEQVLEVTLNPRHHKIYQTHLQRERQKVLGLIHDVDKNRFAIFRSLTLLRQLSLDPALVDDTYANVRSSKADAFLEQLQEVIGEGHRALVFSQFTGFLRTVRDRLDAEGVRYCYLDGRTRNRPKRIEEFKTGDAPVFLISLKAGGVGLNLTEADYCFVLDPWWNPAAEAQAVDRTHRIGQDKTVMVYRLVSTGTIEEKVMALKARKQDLFARVMDDGALLSSPLSADDIRGLLEP